MIFRTYVYPIKYVLPEPSKKNKNSDSGQDKDKEKSKFEEYAEALRDLKIWLGKMGKEKKKFGFKKDAYPVNSVSYKLVEAYKVKGTTASYNFGFWNGKELDLAKVL